jgi:hypothetical protein
VEREKRSGHACDWKGATYSLEVERSGKKSGHGCNCKGGKDDVLPGDGEGKKGQVTAASLKSKEDVLPGCGEGGKEVKSRLQL